MVIDMDVACWIAVRWCGGCGVVALVWCGLSVGVGVVPVGCRWCWCWVVWAGWCALFGHGEALVSGLLGPDAGACARAGVR